MMAYRIGNPRFYPPALQKKSLKKDKNKNVLE
jgi:hypothetical protein